MLDVHHKLPVSAALVTAYYAAPQEPDDARVLFEAACAAAGYAGEPELPLRPGRGAGSSLVLAREWGLTDLAERLAAAIDASFEPTWDRASGEFTWAMGLGEPHPRGQFNAFLAAAEASGPGLWSRVSAQPVERCPQVVDVDFPAVALRRAEWLDGELHLALAPLEPDSARTTTFRVIGVEPGSWTVEGDPAATLTRGDGELTVTTAQRPHELRIRPASADLSNDAHA